MIMTCCQKSSLGTKPKPKPEPKPKPQTPNPESKFWSSQWESPSSLRPKKAQHCRSQVKVMLIVFFDISWVVHHEYILNRQTVNQQVWKEILVNLRDTIRHERSELWPSGDYYLHHDNSPACTAMTVRNYLAENKVLCSPSPILTWPGAVWLLPVL